MTRTRTAGAVAALIAVIALLAGPGVGGNGAAAGTATTRSIAATVPHADQRRLVFAFSYPWFGPSSYDDARLSDHPVTRWNQWSSDDALAELAQARAGGIDGFIQSWSGADRDGAQFD